MASDADGEGGWWVDEEFGVGYVFEDEAENCECEDAVESATGGAVRMMEEIGRIA